uniref:EGF-like domain-containing protein n=1 Tax=Rhabditophanes sp. KR3021 TaxID=114890 RepID=A0AC35UFA9_9BILA
MCTSDEDCGLRLIGACKLQTEIKSDLPKKFCTNVDKNNHYGTDLRPGEDCPPGTTPNQYLFKCLRPFRKFGEVCGKATGHGKTISQCGVDIACNPSLINPTCTKICTSHTDCFDNQNQYSCVSMADAVDGWPSKFCNVGKAPQCISNPQCVSKGSLFTCNLFTLQCVLPEGIPIGFPCAPLGNPCYKSVCNSQVKRCTLPCEGVNAHCGSPSNPGTCVLEQDITKSSDMVYVCKLNYIPPGCSTANYCTSPSVCNRYSYTCETRPTIGQRCMASALSCAAPYVCNHLTKSKDSFCTTPCASDACDDNCDNNFICTETVDPTFNGGPIKVCVAPESCGPTKQCEEGLVCNPFGFNGSSCTQTCLFNSECNVGEGETCKVINDPANVGKIILVCVPSNYAQCDVLNPCSFPEACDLKNSLCQTMPGYGESCNLKGIQCKIGYTCNRYSISDDERFSCTRACDDNDDCGNNGRCITTFDSINEKAVSVCRGEDLLYFLYLIMSCNLMPAPAKELEPVIGAAAFKKLNEIHAQCIPPRQRMKLADEVISALPDDVQKKLPIPVFMKALPGDVQEKMRAIFSDKGNTFEQKFEKVHQLFKGIPDDLKIKCAPPPPTGLEFVDAATREKLTALKTNFDMGILEKLDAVYNIINALPADVKAKLGPPKIDY